MKKIKINKVILQVEIGEHIESGTQLLLDEDFKISNGIVVNTELGVSLVYEPLINDINGKPLNERNYENANNLVIDNRKYEQHEYLKSRKATLSEETLISEYICKQHLLFGSTNPSLPNLDLIVYDISESNKLVYNLNCSISTFDNGEKEIFHNVEKYNIRHDLVYEVSEYADFLEFDEDISGITNIL